jgi:hypothetical protein
MKQTELNQAVAAITGETVAEIRHRGFGLESVVDPEPHQFDSYVDWEQLETQRCRTYSLPQPGSL